MKDKINATNSSVISVIDEFDYSTQNEAYNEKFRQWRSNKNNPFAFNYKKDLKETVFSDSKGFVNTTVAEAEKQTVTGIMQILGVAMLLAVFMDSFFSRLLILILDTIGVDIHCDFFTNAFYGGGSEVVSMTVLNSFLCILTPMIYLHYKLKLPFRVEMMSKVNSSIEVVNSIALTLMACTVVCLPTAYSGKSHNVYEFFASQVTDDVSLWEQSDFIVFFIFNIVILPVVSEILFRGATFAALRQFGDIFAIVISTLTACLLTRDVAEMPAAIIISIVASLGMLRSGTIITAFFVRIIHRMYSATLMLLSVDSSVQSFVNRNTFMLVVFIAGAVVFCALYLVRRSKKQHYLSFYKPHTSSMKRYGTAFTAFPFPLMAGICILEAVINILL